MPLPSKTSQVEFNPSADSILVNCNFTNKKNVFNTDLVFDTGATTTIISWSIANTLGLKPALAKKKIPFYTASGKVEAPLLTVDGVKIGDTCVNNLEVIVHDLPQESGVYGLLGLNFLRNFIVAMDFKKGKITFDLF